MKPRTLNRRSFFGLSAGVVGGTGLRLAWSPIKAEAITAKATALLGGFTWIIHAGFRVTDGKRIIYFDPIKITKDDHDADLVFVSHPHSDHCEAGSVRKIAKESTKLVTEPDAAAKLNLVVGDIITMKPGETISLDDINVKAVPAYNISKQFHPKANNWLGFVVTLGDGRRVYHAGDTDHIPEMADISTDVALLPVGGTYTMDAQQGAEAAKTIKPAVAVPMHYGSVVGNPLDGRRFEQLVAGAVEVMVFSHGQAVPLQPNKVHDWVRQ